VVLWCMTPYEGKNGKRHYGSKCDERKNYKQPLNTDPTSGYDATCLKQMPQS